MRTINLDDYTTLELWSGRRLYAADATTGGFIIIALPKGAVVVTPGKTDASNDQAAFGSVGATTLLVNGNHGKGRVTMLAVMLQVMEQPTGEGRVLLT